MIAYKLLKVRKDGTLGPLFINRRQRIPIGKWLKAEEHRTSGYKFRPGWHSTVAPVAPHLSEKGREWYMIEIKDYDIHDRPESQGGRWFVSKRMKVIEKVKDFGTKWNEQMDKFGARRATAKEMLNI